jgi:hypothetical protein
MEVMLETMNVGTGLPLDVRDVEGRDGEFSSEGVSCCGASSEL